MGTGDQGNPGPANPGTRRKPGEQGTGGSREPAKRGKPGACSRICSAGVPPAVAWASCPRVVARPSWPCQDHGQDAHATALARPALLDCGSSAAALDFFHPFTRGNTQSRWRGPPPLGSAALPLPTSSGDIVRHCDRGRPANCPCSPWKKRAAQNRRRGYPPADRNRGGLRQPAQGAYGTRRWCRAKDPALHTHLSPWAITIMC